jgi:hypothetical protein
MQKIIGFGILSFVKIFSHLFFRGEFKWITPSPEKPWDHARLMVFLNHTSLFEPLFIQQLSFSFLWKLVARANVPGADITLNRPLVGRSRKLMFPNISSVTRKKDHSWNNYLKSIRPDSLILIAPEGRMKRPSGLDKFGKPMTVKGGVADILENINEGAMILCLSGGLHHVQTPGQHLPRLFKTIRMNLAYFDIKDYKDQFQSLSPRERKIKITQDMQAQLEKNCPIDPVT